MIQRSAVQIDGEILGQWSDAGALGIPPRLLLDGELAPDSPIGAANRLLASGGRRTQMDWVRGRFASVERRAAAMIPRIGLNEELENYVLTPDWRDDIQQSGGEGNLWSYGPHPGMENRMSLHDERYLVDRAPLFGVQSLGGRTGLIPTSPPYLASSWYIVSGGVVETTNPIDGSGYYLRSDDGFPVAIGVPGFHQGVYFRDEGVIVGSGGRVAIVNVTRLEADLRSPFTLSDGVMVYPAVLNPDAGIVRIPRRGSDALLSEAVNRTISVDGRAYNLFNAATPVWNSPQIVDAGISGELSTVLSVNPIWQAFASYLESWRVGDGMPCDENCTSAWSEEDRRFYPVSDADPGFMAFFEAEYAWGCRNLANGDVPRDMGAKARAAYQAARQDGTLPSSHRLATDLDHGFTLTNAFGVKRFSPEHYAVMFRDSNREVPLLFNDEGERFIPPFADFELAGRTHRVAPFPGALFVANHRDPYYRSLRFTPGTNTLDATYGVVLDIPSTTLFASVTRKVTSVYFRRK